MMETEQERWRLRGSVKWFNADKGYGFILPEDGGPDVFLHVNALRSFGQGSVCDDAGIEVLVQETQRGLQVVEVLTITPPADGGAGEDAADTLPEGLQALPLEPAKVKWFDKMKGFGFGNVFGRGEDVFIHIEVLRRSGFADLQPGEAIAMRIVDGERGRQAVVVTSWETALEPEQG